MPAFQRFLRYTSSLQSTAMPSFLLVVLRPRASVSSSWSASVSCNFGAKARISWTKAQSQLNVTSDKRCFRVAASLSTAFLPIFRRYSAAFRRYFESLASVEQSAAGARPTPAMADDDHDHEEDQGGKVRPRYQLHDMGELVADAPHARTVPDGRRMARSAARMAPPMGQARTAVGRCAMPCRADAARNWET